MEKVYLVWRYEDWIPGEDLISIFLTEDEAMKFIRDKLIETLSGETPVPSWINIASCYFDVGRNSWDAHVFDEFDSFGYYIEERAIG